MCRKHSSLTHSHTHPQPVSGIRPQRFFRPWQRVVSRVCHAKRPERCALGVNQQHRPHGHREQKPNQRQRSRQQELEQPTPVPAVGLGPRTPLALVQRRLTDFPHVRPYRDQQREQAPRQRDQRGPPELDAQEQASTDGRQEFATNEDPDKPCFPPQEVRDWVARGSGSGSGSRLENGISGIQRRRENSIKHICYEVFYSKAIHSRRHRWSVGVFTIACCCTAVTALYLRLVQYAACTLADIADNRFHLNRTV